MTRFDDRVALVTGGARGMGRNHALRLAEAGAAVTVFDLGGSSAVPDPGYPLAGQSDLESIVAEIQTAGGRALAVAGDVREQADLDAAVAQTVEAFGRLDIVVANAGITINGPAWEMTRDEWDKVIDVNLTGVWQTCKAAIPQMLSQHYGRIILISSIMGVVVGQGAGAYSAAKFGVNALGMTLALELGPHGITVNTLCPGTVPTGLNQGQFLHKGLDADKLLQEWGPDSQAIPHLLDADDVTNAVLFYASDAARYVTGTVLPVDGGAVIWRHPE